MKIILVFPPAPLIVRARSGLISAFWGWQGGPVHDSERLGQNQRGPMIYDDPQRSSRLARHRNEEKAQLVRMLREAMPVAELVGADALAEDIEQAERPRRPLLSIRT